MQQIEVDFEVFKGLTMLRQSESHTYNEVVRELMGLQTTEKRALAVSFSQEPLLSGSWDVGGFNARGLFLPNSTLLQAKHKGLLFRHRIEEGKWVDELGYEFSSPSAAANFVTRTTVNGLRFWLAKRPSDTEWRKLSALPKINR